MADDRLAEQRQVANRDLPANDGNGTEAERRTDLGKGTVLERDRIAHQRQARVVRGGCDDGDCRDPSPKRARDDWLSWCFRPR
jgi:hypothetical protein